MPFNSDTARDAGKKSKRGKARLGQEIKEKLEQLSTELIESIDLEELSTSDKVRLLGIVCSYILPKYKATAAPDVSSEFPQEISIQIIDNNGEVIKRNS
jgi:hypothetical protein